ncbi:MAG: bifunctional diaminohydroxyphosphoribosylaminopyrimidine deaminase/5-amino-6-(5-phosphoribosylamino)uracil reductase RibD [Steroidobacter sp.]
MFSPFDERMMRRAIELAGLGRHTTQPNPCVGCVITQGERIVGEGWHRKWGEPHAEVLALRAAGEAAKGATVYVTLEPHSYQGRTPPCTDALIRAGVSRVVSGVLDANPKVSGDGVRQLQAAGIAAEVGLLADEARELNLGFEKRMQTGLPRVIVKSAISLDGRIALANGESKWITGEAARADVQRLRARMSAVLTGIETVLADDPQLNVRDPAIDMYGRQPLRVVLDSKLRMPATARMLSLPGETLIVSATAATRSPLASAELVTVASDEHGRVDLHSVMQELGRRLCNDVLVEAGPTLVGRVLHLGLADELIVYIAPTLLGPDARPMAQLPLLTQLSQAQRYTLHSHDRIGDDVRLVLRRPL